MDAPLSGQERPRITQGAILSKVMTSVTRIPDLGLSTLGLILVRGSASGLTSYESQHLLGEGQWSSVTSSWELRGAQMLYFTL